MFRSNVQYAKSVPYLLGLGLGLIAVFVLMMVANPTRAFASGTTSNGGTAAQNQKGGIEAKANVSVSLFRNFKTGHLQVRTTVYTGDANGFVACPTCSTIKAFKYKGKKYYRLVVKNGEQIIGAQYEYDTGNPLGNYIGDRNWNGMSALPRVKYVADGFDDALFTQRVELGNAYVRLYNSRYPTLDSPCGEVSCGK